jgi:putative glutamine amidotransferase
MQQPLVAISTDVKAFENYTWHATPQQYLEAALTGAGVFPVLVPSFGDRLDLDRLLSSVDGVMVTGSKSNVHPSLYGGDATEANGPYDPARDATTLPLIRAAVAEGVPVFGICRGLQEMNVAFGGTLHQHLQEVPGRFDHRHDRSRPREVAYTPKHDVSLATGGYLRSLTNVSELRVNSLHGQGVDRLGKGLVLEAEAPDETIEGFRVDGAARFAIGVQWHPEGLVDSCGLSASLFARFGAAARERAAARNGHG